MDTENQPLEDMEVELPKRVFPPGHEPLVTHINNNCKMSTLKLKELLPSEYKKLKTESVFAPIISIYENELNYSARLIHNFVCRQLVTYKVRELWFVWKEALKIFVAKVPFDQWEAANDPILTERMATYEPEESDSIVLHID